MSKRRDLIAYCGRLSHESGALQAAAQKAFEAVEKKRKECAAAFQELQDLTRDEFADAGYPEIAP